MSPLVALLALACAAPLAVQANYCQGPVTQTGEMTTSRAQLKPIYIEVGMDPVKVDIPDVCTRDDDSDWTVVGVTVELCSSVPVKATVPSKYPFSPVIVALTSSPRFYPVPVKVLVTEYCDLANG